MADFRQLASGIYLEGLAVDHERDIVWYSDVVGGGVHGVAADGSVQSFNLDRQWTGGLMLNADGAVLSTGAGGIMWNDPETGRSGWLLDRIDGRPINGINEMCPDGAGGLIFGTCDIERIAIAGTPRPSALHHLAADGELTLLAEGIDFANGLMLSADRRRLYCNNTFHGTCVFDVSAKLALTNRRLLVEKPDCDGMALDVEGNLWITGFQSGHLMRVKPDGAALDPVATPAGAITQVRFGGADMRDMYITAVPPDGGESLKDGVPLSEKNSLLYRGRSRTAGMRIAPTRFTLDG